MGQYGSGMSMSHVIANEYNKVTHILNKSSGLVGMDKSSITDCVREFAFQWCKANALSCAMEDWMKRNLSEEDFARAMREITTSSVLNEKMDATYPWQ